MTPSKDIARLIEIMAALRTPESGCPWDLEQTFATIAPYTIEEAYEVADAIERNDLADLKDELGDLLLQVVYHARLAEEEGAFAFPDVVEAVTAKMIRRHPHVFGDADVREAAALEDQWDRIKAAERAQRMDADLPSTSTKEGKVSSQRRSILSDIPIALPALTRAVKLQNKAAKVGFDWPSLAPVFQKLEEELRELEEVALPADPRGDIRDDTAATRTKIEEELGDLLFVVANVARHLDIDPETALRRANEKFVRRFNHIEARLAAEGKAPETSSLAEMDALWDEAKANERT